MFILKGNSVLLIAVVVLLAVSIFSFYKHMSLAKKRRVICPRRKNKPT